MQPSSTIEESQQAGASDRRTVLITHANPEDNAFARWLAARLSMSGYRVWLDLRSLNGGDDFWDEIEDQLRNKAIKQIVLISPHVRKPGVKKELALGDYVGKQLADPDFMIPVRLTNVPHGEFPPELLRRNAFDAFPNWAAVLPPIFKTLSEAAVPKVLGVEGGLLHQMIEAQEAGRLALAAKPEKLLSNWFDLAVGRPTLRFFAAKGTSDQLDAWLKTTGIPHVQHSGLVATFCDPVTFAQAGDQGPELTARFWIPFDNLVAGRDIDPFPSRGEARRSLMNLMRQHWDYAMLRRGLLPFEFASGQRGWFFPDGLIDGPAKGSTEDGRRLSRLLSGKFKERRWHLCLVAQPKSWPSPFVRVHANVALSLDGRTPLSGQQTQKVRTRLTRSWWNDKWRDLLLASMSWLSDGGDTINLAAGDEPFGLLRLPLSLDFPVSYAAEEARPVEEDATGEISLSDELDEGDDNVVSSEIAAGVQ
ncbi:MAG TPA: toll/interleukin-1 receptor domain-containing protein [Caulobacteraceae bacterium]|nr:toll/interleukin-1 receptor domain-containing protein [Caulobacteraceae bacterium]